VNTRFETSHPYYPTGERYLAPQHPEDTLGIMAHIAVAATSAGTLEPGQPEFNPRDIEKQSAELKRPVGAVALGQVLRVQTEQPLLDSQETFTGYARRSDYELAA